jgi:hypothetical protein
MPALLKEAMRTFVANQFINSFVYNEDAVFSNSDTYVEGDVIVTSGNVRYIATTAIPAGQGEPTHQVSTVIGGWRFIEVNIDTNHYFNNVYLCAGAGNDDAVQPVGVDSEDKPILDGIIYMEKLTTSSVKLATFNSTWTPGVPYPEYDGTNQSNETFFVVYDDGGTINIYKCLDNNGGENSTSPPTGTSSSPITTTDGYVWKYMGTVPTTDYTDFTTNSYIPLTENSAIKASAVAGSISKININQPTVDFTGEGLTLVATNGDLSGTGVDFTADPVEDVTNGLISATITNYGGGYGSTPMIKFVYTSAGAGLEHIQTITISSVDATTGAITGIDLGPGGYYPGTIDPATNISISTASGSGAILTPILNENNKLTGFDIVDGGTNYLVAEVITMVDSDHNYSGNTYIAYDVDYSIVMQPKNGHGFNIFEELYARFAVIRGLFFDTESGYFPVGIGSQFSQVSLVVDPVDDDTNNVAVKSKFIGPAHDEYDTTSTLNKIKPNTGSLLYSDALATPITRNANQSENIKIILKF